MGISPALADQAPPSSLVAAAEAWTPRDGSRIEFDVFRQGNRFGRHSLQFKMQADGRLNVSTEVELAVKFGFVTVYRYTLKSEEIWEDGNLISLIGTTSKNGEEFEVAAQTDGDVMIVDGTGFRGEVPVPIIPSSHWNRLQVYRDQMLSTESGEILDIDVETLGRDRVFVDGQPVEATHYRLNSKLSVDLWYDDQSRWVKLAFNARGQEIEYVLSAGYD